MTIHLRVLGPDEEVPGEGYAVRRGGYGFGLYLNGKGVSRIKDDLIPFLKELMALAQKGEQYDELNEKYNSLFDSTFEKHKDAPDPLIAAIRDVGASVIEAIGLHGQGRFKEITAIAERVRLGK